MSIKGKREAESGGAIPLWSPAVSKRPEAGSMGQGAWGTGRSPQRIIESSDNRQRITALILFCLLLLSTLLLAGPKDYYIYVASESSDIVSLVKFDGKKATVEKQIEVGVWPVEIEGPHGLTVGPEGDYWYLSMAHGKPYGHVYKYSTADNKVVARVELGFFPATMEISPATGFLYVVNFNLHGDHVPSSVSIVDPESMIEVERVTTGVMPHGSRISPDGRRHYSVAMMSGELFEIDALAMSVARKLYIGHGEPPPAHDMMDHSKMDHSKMDHKKPEHKKPDHKKPEHKKMAHHEGHAGGDKTAQKMPMPKPTWVFPDPTGKFVYIANNGIDEVVEVDLEKWEVTRRFATAPGPYNVEISPDGKYMVVTYKSDASTGIWDLKKGKELRKIKNKRKVSHGIVISPDSRYTFISVEGIGGEPGAVDIIDLKKQKLVASVDVAKQAGGIAFWKIVSP